MATVARGRNEPPPPQIIVKKIVQASHEAHHGGAWKIAYADFITAMMAFFLLLWLVGATDEAQRQGLADYFTPTLIEYKQNSAGSNGIMNGQSIVSADNYPNRPQQTGSRSLVIPRDSTGGQNEATGPKWQEMQRFAQLKAELLRRIEANPQIRDLKTHISFTQSDEGLRIDLVDEADFSMFEVGTDRLRPQAQQLVREVAQVISGVPNRVVVRGHTDSRPFARGQVMNNWLLSTARAETTRTALEGSGVMLNRFTRIEGVADREPFVPGDRLDPRNRRISVTLASTDPEPAGAPPRPAGQ
ncbi:MAG TPA: flagellar motor protein MotB [Allosphingosinicella sp.]|jgi:chemotaxis protein MotB